MKQRTTKKKTNTEKDKSEENMTTSTSEESSNEEEDVKRKNRTQEKQRKSKESSTDKSSSSTKNTNSNKKKEVLKNESSGKEKGKKNYLDKDGNKKQSKESSSSSNRKAKILEKEKGIRNNLTESDSSDEDSDETRNNEKEMRKLKTKDLNRSDKESKSTRTKGTDNENIGKDGNDNTTQRERMKISKDKDKRNDKRKNKKIEKESSSDEDVDLDVVDSQTASARDINQETDLYLDSIQEALSAALGKKIQEGKEKLTTAKIKEDCKKEFNLKNDVHVTDEIPRLFSILSRREGYTREPVKEDVGPKYLKKSVDEFGFPLIESRVVLKSEHLKPEVSLNLFDKPPENERRIIQYGGEAGNMDYEHRVEMIIQMIFAIFKIYRAVQVIIANVKQTAKSGPDKYSGDYVSQFDMIGNKYVNQDVPLFPAGGYMDETNYMNQMIKEMFTDENHRMYLGVVEYEKMTQIKMWTEMACFTDQYFATLNKMYIDSLCVSRPNFEDLRNQLSTLTFFNIEIRSKSPALEAFHYYPVWSREESDAALLIYALSPGRQLQYYYHGVELLRSTKLVMPKTLEQVRTFSNTLKDKGDTTLQREYNSFINTSHGIELYNLVVLSMSCLWIDVRMVDITVKSADPIEAIFNILTVCLWYLIFPEIAVDNSPSLMYILFRSLNVFVPDEVRQFVQEIGFTSDSLTNSIYRVPPQYQYQQGSYMFPFLNEEQIPMRYPTFRSLKALFQPMGNQTCETRDNACTLIPRFRDVRTYYQPWRYLPENEPYKDFETRFLNVITFLQATLAAYEKTVAGKALKSATGVSPAKYLIVRAFFDDFREVITDNTAAVIHAQLFRLRELYANSIYYVDDNFDGSYGVRTNRPRVFGKDKFDFLSPYNFKRGSVDIPFRSIMSNFMSMKPRVYEKVEKIIAPNPLIEYFRLRSIQSEAMVFGDVLYYAQMLKFKDTSEWYRTLRYVFGNYLTSSRYSTLITELSKVVDINFDHIFEFELDGIMQAMDARSNGFTIAMSKFNTAAVTPIAIEGTSYGDELRFGSAFMKQSIPLITKLFTPETSPIPLYTRGLFISKQVVERLDPDQWVSIPEYAEKHRVEIRLWDSRFVTTRVSGDSRLETERILRIFDDKNPGQYKDYMLQDEMPTFLFIVNTKTGPLQRKDAEFLYQFVTLNKISFFLPDVLVLREKILMTFAANDYKIEEQYYSFLTGPPDSRITLTLYDMTAQILSVIRGSVKWLFLAQPPEQNDIILRHLLDGSEVGPRFKMCNWTMWAFGRNQGTTLHMTKDELIDTLAHDTEMVDALSNKVPHAPESITHDTALVPKISRREVNFNNTVKLLEDKYIFKIPEYELTENNIGDGLLWNL